MNESERKHRRSRHTLFWIIFLEVLLLLGALSYVVITFESGKRDSDIEDTTIAYQEQTEAEVVSPVPQPEVDEQLLTVNEWSRPGKKIKELDYIVVHYLANPETTAQQNHDYFESLKDLQNASMSANYVIGLEGEIIQCVPDDEVAYASNDMNSYSISIENCHPDESGKFTKPTYNSLVHLVAFLSDTYGLDRDHIIRHYDVTGKECPKYYVDHPDKWEAFLDDVMEYRQKYHDLYEAQREAERLEQASEVDELTQFMEKNVDGK